MLSLHQGPALHQDPAGPADVTSATWWFTIARHVDGFSLSLRSFYCGKRHIHKLYHLNWSGAHSSVAMSTRTLCGRHHCPLSSHKAGTLSH